MNKSALVLTASLLAACNRTTPMDAVAYLIAHPDRLREIEQQCANNYAQVGAAECNVASQARHRLFIGNGPQYAPSKEPPNF
ncbi:MAG: EexN family lipoprotein [Paraburkholderia sp.]|uniref:EexN family lipoprotein n=1 Tax=Burkholderiaceae TaxID=119060 RepID=UPI0010F6C908|nr:EexN family lipoprotein [Burkholderia sp. 4M9327F10]